MYSKNNSKDRKLFEGEELEESISSKINFLNNQTKMKRASFMPMRQEKKFRSDTDFHNRKRVVKKVMKKWNSAEQQGNSSLEPHDIRSLAKKMRFKPLKKKEIVDDYLIPEPEIKHNYPSSIESFDQPKKPDFNHESLLNVSIDNEIIDQNSECLAEDEETPEKNYPILLEKPACELSSIKLLLSQDKLQERNSEFSILFSSMDHELIKSNYKEFIGGELEFEKSCTEKLRKKDQNRLTLDRNIYDRIVDAINQDGNITYQDLALAFFPEGTIPNFTSLCNFRLVERMIIGLD